MLCNIDYWLLILIVDARLDQFDLHSLPPSQPTLYNCISRIFSSSPSLHSRPNIDSINRINCKTFKSAAKPIIVQYLQSAFVHLSTTCFERKPFHFHSNFPFSFQFPIFHFIINLILNRCSLLFISISIRFTGDFQFRFYFSFFNTSSFFLYWRWSFLQSPYFIPSFFCWCIQLLLYFRWLIDFYNFIIGGKHLAKAFWNYEFSLYLDWEKICWNCKRLIYFYRIFNV